MLEFAHIIQFFALSAGLIAIYIAITNYRKEKTAALKIYSQILIAVNLIVLVHVFEAFFRIVASKESYNILFRANVLYIIIFMAAVRFFMLAAFFKLLFVALSRRYHKTYDWLVFSVFFVLTTAMILFKDDNSKVFFAVHFMLNLTIAISSILIFLHGETGHVFNPKWKNRFVIVLVLFALSNLGLRFLRILPDPMHEDSQMLGIGLAALLFNLFNAVFLQKVFRTEKQGAASISLQDLFVQYQVSKREQEIVSLICEGKTNKEIADLLFISPITVRDHLSNIYKKVNVNNRTQLARVFSV